MVLDLDPIASHDLSINKRALADNTVGAESCAGADVSVMPHAGATT